MQNPREPAKPVPLSLEVVIPTYCRARLAEGTIHSRAERPANLLLRVDMADHNSPDEIGKVVRSLGDPVVHFHAPVQAAVVAARNL